MASGKSSLGLRIARRGALAFLDTDRWIEGRAGRSVAEIFAREGEGAFRRWERRAVAEASSRCDTVIATGGGVGLQPANMERLSRSGRIYELRCSFVEIRSRLMGCKTRRPLLGEKPGIGADGLHALWLGRRRLYRGWGTVVSTDGRDLDELAEEILGLHREAR